MLHGMMATCFQNIVKTNNIGLKTIIKLSKGLEITPSEFIDDENFLSDKLDLE